MVSLSVGAFSQRETVGCEHKLAPVSGNRLQAIPAFARTWLEGRIGTQKVEIVAVRVAASDRQHAASQHIGNRVRDVRRVAWIGD